MLIVNPVNVHQPIVFSETVASGAQSNGIRETLKMQAFCKKQCEACFYQRRAQLTTTQGLRECGARLLHHPHKAYLPHR